MDDYVVVLGPPRRRIHWYAWRFSRFHWGGLTAVLLVVTVAMLLAGRLVAEIIFVDLVVLILGSSWWFMHFSLTQPYRRSFAGLPTARIDDSGLHFRVRPYLKSERATGCPADPLYDALITWPETLGWFVRRTSTGAEVVCIQPRDLDSVLARLPRWFMGPGLGANLNTFGVPLVLQVWEPGRMPEVLAGKEAHGCGRLE
jgi:hypothetical protein